MTLLDIAGINLVESNTKNKDNEDGERTWSAAVHILLPVAALAILWGRRGFFARFFLQFDQNCVSVLCPSFSKRQQLLKWASSRLSPWSPHTNAFLSGPVEFWRDGSILCTLINSAIPGACPNPQLHRRQTPSHGQALAFKYLGVIPIFTEPELYERVTNQENALFSYLLKIQHAVEKLSEGELKFSSRYVARGIGLSVGEQHRKSSFYIYSTATAKCSKHEVLVTIKGPYNNHSTVTISPRSISKKVVGKKLIAPTRSQKFLRSLSVDLGSLINQKQINDIPVKLITEKDRVKVVFVPKHSGIHEISIVTNGFHVVGSPFCVNIIKNTSRIIDDINKKSTTTEKCVGEKIITRKIISKFIDFINEKIDLEMLQNNNAYVIPTIKIIDNSVTDVKLDQEESNLLRCCNNLNPSLIKQYDDNSINMDPKSLSLVTSLNSKSLDDLNNNAVRDGNYFCDSPKSKYGHLITPSICLNHIDTEVNAQADKSSEIPIGKFRKELLQKQENIEDSMSLDEQEKEKETEGEDPSYGRENTMINNLKFFSPTNGVINTSDREEIISKPWIQARNTLFESVQHEQVESLLEKHKDAEIDKNSSSMSILNYLSALKSQEAIWTSTKSIPEKMKSFNSCLEYWESRINFLPNKRNVRYSLPNLCTNKEYFAQNQSSYRCDLYDEPDLLLKSQFKERQEYWRILCAQNCSYVSLQGNNSLNNLPCSNHKYKSRRSLPDLYSKEAVYRNSTYLIDFFDRNNLMRFQDKFRARREFWEKLSNSQNVLNSQDNNYSDVNIYSDEDDEEGIKDNFEHHANTSCDSGFYNSLPNLFQPREGSDLMNLEKIPSLDFRLQYETKKKYWEELSSSQVNLKHNPTKFLKVMEKINKVQTVYKGNCESKNQRESNLTDDLKYMNEYKEKMKNQFIKAFKYFSDLETHHKKFSNT